MYIREINGFRPRSGEEVYVRIVFGELRRCTFTIRWQCFLKDCQNLLNLVVARGSLHLRTRTRIKVAILW